METKEVPIESIEVSTYNVRKNLSDGQQDSSLGDLAKSIEAQGLLSPIIVFVKSEGRYSLVAGQRRYLACKQLGWDTIRATVYEHITESEATAISLVENVQRADMNPMDKARAFKSLEEQLGDLASVGRRTGLGVKTIRKYIQLLQLAPSLQMQLAAGEAKNTEALARLAQRFDDPDVQVEVWDKVRGFTQDVQQQIIKGIDQQLLNLDDLVDRAVEGEFNKATVSNCPFDCPHIPPHIKSQVAALMGIQQQ